MRRNNADHNMLTADEEGRLFRIFNPPRRQFWKWAWWYVTALFERVDAVLDPFAREHPRRRWIDVAGHGRRRVVSDSLVLRNVPRVR